MTFNELQKDKIEQLEQLILGKTNQIEQYFLEMEQLQEEMGLIREEKVKFESKCKRLKTKIDDIDAVNLQLNQQLEERQKLIDEQKLVLEQAGRLGSFKGANSLSSMNHGEGSVQDEDDATEGNTSQLTKGKKKHVKTVSQSILSLLQSGQKDKAKYSAKFMEFQLGKKRDRTGREHPSQQAYEKFKKKGSSKIKNIMPKTLLLKTITQTYLELQSLNNNGRMPSLIPYIYDQMMHKYGIKKIGLEKFI